MGQLSVENGEIRVSGAPPYTLPDYEPDFLSALFTSEPGEEGFIGDVMRHFSPQEKLDVKLAAKRHGGDVYRDFCRAAGKWVAVVNPDNKWHLEDFVPLYEAEVNTAWAHNVIITDANIRFITTPSGLVTFPEFQYVYGMNLLEHLDSHVAQLASRFTNIKRHITAELVRKTLLVTDRRGNIVTKVFPVLSSLPAEQWALPSGYSLVSEAVS